MRTSPPTRFPKLPVLKPQDLARLKPAERAVFVAEKQHQDDWGHLPPQLHQHLRGVKPEDLGENAVEKHAKSKKTDPVHFAAAKAYHKWAIGQELEPDAYDAAIETVLNERHGY